MGRRPSAWRERDAYWNWFADHWNVNKAVQVVEDVISAGGRPRWIAYRVIFGSGETAYLLGRGDSDRTEFVEVTVWVSLAAMRAFTGENGEPPLSSDDARFLIGGAPAVVHYGTVDPPG